MASIVKRNNKFSVVYSFRDESGKRRQKWETFLSQEEANRRKAQVESLRSAGEYFEPGAKTVRELLKDYVSIYGVNKWSVSTYKSRKGLIDNYINPLIGDVRLDDLTPRMMDKYYQSLLAVKAKPHAFGAQRCEFVTPSQVKEVHKVLHCAFNQGVKWELLSRNPVANATLPACEKHTRSIWTAETLQRATELCEDDILGLAINIAFAASLRMGEMLGLTWDCVDIAPEKIASGYASIYITKELQRVSKDALEALHGKGVIFIFPTDLPDGRTRLVLKEPKTKTSVRRVFLPKTVAEMLAARKTEIEKRKKLLGEEYHDYDLVFCSAGGTPVEGCTINSMLQKLIAEHDLPKIVFHSIRHTSTTYKLKLSGGDIKAVQGDTGHANAAMVTDQYAHILDDDRRRNAARFEETFYTPAGGEKAPEADEEQELIRRLLANPDALALLKALVHATADV